MILASLRSSAFAGLLALVVALFAKMAFAQMAPPQLRTNLSADQVAVGEAFTLSIEANVGSGSPAPQDPRLSLPSGLTATGPSISTKSHVAIINGRITQSTGISASWRVVADRAGTFSIPGPTVLWDGKRVQSHGATVTVHKGAPRPAAPRANPFDPFGLLPQLPGLFDAQEPRREPIVPDELAIDVAPDPYVFFRAIADKETAVVGEQVTLSIYLYSRVRVEWTDVHEPSLADFFRRDLMSPGDLPETHRLLIDGVPWRAQRVFHAAIFPLRAGNLDVGKESASILGAGRGNGARGGVIRESQPLQIRVTEPPAAGRPPGYQLGDVGKYSMVASVEPRTVEQGGAVAVTVTLSGTGNVPPAVRVPMQSGVEWLEPQMRESFEAERGKIRGSRTFTYLVRPKVAGTLDLGEITLPYWDPEQKAYEVARAPLGKLRVTPVDGVEASDPGSSRDPFAAIAGPRTRLEPLAPATSPITDSRTFWLGIFGAPMAVVMASALSRSIQALRSRRAEKKGSAASALEKALDDAKAAQKANDLPALASAVDRIVYLSIEAATGLKTRALMLDEIPKALETRGIEAELALRVREILALAESIRFADSQGISGDDLLARARSISRDLRRSAKGAA